MQASLSTGAGGFGLSSAEARRMSASVGSLVATVPEVFADLSGAMGQSPEGDVLFRPRSVRLEQRHSDSRDVHGVSEEVMDNTCRNVGGPEPLEKESKMPQGNRLRKCCQHTTPKLSAAAKRSIDRGNS